MTRNGTAPLGGADSAPLSALSGWRRRAWPRNVLLILLTVGVFLLLFRKIDVARVLVSMRTIPVTTWLGATLLTLSFPVMSAARWHLVLRAIGHHVPVARCLRIILGIWPLAAISPSKAGDLLKAYSLRRDIGALVVAGTVLVERALDLVTLAALALVGGLTVADRRLVSVAALVLVGVVAGLAVVQLDVPLPVGQKVRAKARDLMGAARALRRRPLALALVVGLTVLNWLASIVQTGLLFDGVGASVPFAFTLGALPVAIFAGLIPVTFGGMGTRDAAMVVLFAPHASGPQALTVGLLYSVFGYWLPALVGLPFMRRALGHP